MKHIKSIDAFDITTDKVLLNASDQHNNNIAL